MKKYYYENFLELLKIKYYNLFYKMFSPYLIMNSYSFDFAACFCVGFLFKICMFFALVLVTRYLLIFCLWLTNLETLIASSNHFVLIVRFLTSLINFLVILRLFKFYLVILMTFDFLIIFFSVFHIFFFIYLQLVLFLTFNLVGSTST